MTRERGERRKETCILGSAKEVSWGPISLCSSTLSITLCCPTKCFLFNYITEGFGRCKMEANSLSRSYINSSLVAISLLSHGASNKKCHKQWILSWQYLLLMIYRKTGVDAVYPTNYRPHKESHNLTGNKLCTSPSKGFSIWTRIEYYLLRQDQAWRQEEARCTDGKGESMGSSRHHTHSSQLLKSLFQLQ